MEANNNQKMREALEAMVSQRDGLIESVNDGAAIDWEGIVCAMINDAEDALAAPTRNCDVGTAEEQYRRWRIFCDSTDCRDCPCPGEYEPSAVCFCHWSQLPYKEGGAE